ncbi:ubiquitin carboxyl-terminal hydrolase 30-like [Macrobrachium nipponense]|uniref:ubiquitin carboxyl-terminal hydrolase 30-like n=1 Tax=Macrobrachium nipponense TaxID=159736 RepID=UPI0030C896E2
MIIMTVPVNLRSSAIIVGAVIIGAYVIFGGPSDIRRRKKRKGNIPGLANIGNSCFLNALVQSLASCPLFVSWLGSKHQDPSPPLVSALHKLLCVLNNGDDYKGDACAGEVMCALRGHGWVISSEEQDAHELFHALTATIDEELLNTSSMPSLLDVSWMESDGAESFHMGGVGVVFKSDCWSKNRETKRNVVRYEKRLLNSSDASSSVSASSELLEKPSQQDTDISDLKSAQVSDVLYQDVCKYNVSVENGACGSDDVLSGHHNGWSSPGRESDIDENSVSSLKCDNTVEDSSVFTGQRSEIDKCEMDETFIENEPETLCTISKSDVICMGSVSLMKGDKIKRRGYNTVPRMKSRKTELKTQNKLHDNPFQGYLASQLQCTLCGYKNPAQWTSFESLSLSLPSIPWSEVTLQELLDSYITQEKVSDVTCDACSKKAGVDVKTSFTKQLTIGKLPSCLCFHIKRTVWMENGSAVKRQDHVIFPEFLTMDPYTYVTSVSSQGLCSVLLGGREANVILKNSLDSTGTIPQPSSVISHNATSTEVEASPFFRVTSVRCEQLYRLKAVIVHVGDVFCGHFVTYRRGPLGTRCRNRWFYTSDLTVRESNLEEVRKANAYMILYEKVAE